MAVVNINTGTQVAINTQTLGTAEAQVVRIDMGSGTSANAFTGTISAVTNIAGGTISISGQPAVFAEQNNPASLQATVLPIGLRHTDEFATIVSTGTTTLGTIKAAVSGSAIYVTSVVISAGTTTSVVVASGGTSTPVLGSLFFNTNGGLAAQFDPPIRTASGSALVYQQSVGGGLSCTVTGYID